MVHYKAALVGLVTLLTAPLSSAFTPTSYVNSGNPAAKKVELARAKVQDEYTNMVNMNMVAGGAQAEEYYEGTLCYAVMLCCCVILCCVV